MAEEVGRDQGQQAVGGVVGGFSLVETVINDINSFHSFSHQGLIGTEYGISFS